jgi:predicted aldo/keto reductase-like oxidoreductase
MGQRTRIARRLFLKRSALLTGSLVLGVSGHVRAGRAGALEEGREESGAGLRTLGRTGIRIPIFSLGAAPEPSLVQAAWEAGARYFDTAYRYGGGAHERIIGDALKGKPRDALIASTKILGLRDNITGLIPAGVKPADFQADFRHKVEASLKRLRVEYLDILFLHGVERPELVGIPVIKDVIQELKAEGKTRFLGATFHHKELELIPAVVKEGIYDVILTSHNFRQPHRMEVRRAIAEAARDGLGIMAMKTVAGAFWDKERRYPINVKAALKWVLQSEHVHSIIPAVENYDQLAEDAAVMEDCRLTPQEEDDLRFGEKMNLSGLYCAQCGACRSQCRYELDIPTVMRSFMYAYGYGSPTLARETLQERDPEMILCRSCASCAVSCPMRFDVAARMKDIRGLLNPPQAALS